MKTCPNCNSPNKDEFVFCVNCGTKFEEKPAGSTGSIPTPEAPAAGGPETVPVPPASPVYSQDIPLSGASSQAGPASGDTRPKKKSPVLIAILACVAVGVLIFLISSIFSNPTYKLLNGLMKLAKTDKATVNTTVNIAYDGDEDALDVLNKMTFKVQTAADMNNLLAEASIELLYNKKSITKAAAGINNENLYIDPMDLYKQMLYLELDGVVPKYSDTVNDLKILKKALDKVSLKFNTKKYADIIKDVLDDDIRGSGSKVTVTIDAGKSAELMEEILIEAQDDKKLRESIRTNGIKFIKNVLKEEDKFEVLDLDPLEDALEFFEDKDEFEDAYDDAIESALDNIDYMVYDMEDLPETEITFRFGLFGNIKGIDYELEFEDQYNDQTFEISCKSDIKKGANFTKVNTKKAVDIEDRDDMEDALKDIVKNLVKAIKKSDDLVEAIEDAFGADIDDAIEALTGELF